MSDDRNFRGSDKEVAQEGGYPSSQVVGRVFVDHWHMIPLYFRETQQ